ncbi:hypothetical protein [Modestobacter sp. DSM 44400]|uniref:hypothetical protein n=1 Tax=Modestobacter sp. DSM 44400 TaxID=1550230 RepID=UPI001C3194D3|nr:hypothetical protein [Modestobacter sp. DSM 44400]
MTAERRWPRFAAAAAGRPCTPSAVTAPPCRAARRPRQARRAAGPGECAGTHVRARRQPVPRGVGNTQKDADRFASLLADVESRLPGTLPDETWGYPATARTRPSAPSGRAWRSSRAWLAS